MNVSDFSKKTKIVATIGPASQSQDVLEQLIVQGMNIARINFAHGDFDGHRRTIANVRAAAAATGRRMAIFGDLPGPKMRIGKLAAEPIRLQTEQPFALHVDPIVGDEFHAATTFTQLPQVVERGDDIFLNDGFIQLEVVRVESRVVHCRVVVGGELRSHKGINLPDVNLGISAFTELDHKCLRFAAEERLDGISQSFVETAADIEAVRAAADALAYAPFIIAKIERGRALQNLEAILAVTDGIMVARGDLGVEIPIERIAAAQKRLIAYANRAGKPVITATHMLESMITHRRPTRAEATDVANAILDGTDCVMLSGETAVGEFPVDAVATMTRIAQETEKNVESLRVADWLARQRAKGEIARHDLISYNIYQTAHILRPAIVFVPSASGNTARRVTRFRLPQWLVALSHDEQTCQKLQFSYGVFPEYVATEPPSWSRFAREWLRQREMESDLVLLIEGTGTAREGDTTRLAIIDLE